MSAITSIGSAAQRVTRSLERVSAQTGEIADRLARNGNRAGAASSDVAPALDPAVELLTQIPALDLQATASLLVFRKVMELSQSLLELPRKL